MADPIYPNWGSQTNDPKPGDVAVKADGSHVGIVSSVNNGVVTIISGNYSESVAQSNASTGYTFRTHN